MSAQEIVAALLEGNWLVSARRLVEAVVRLPPRGHRYVAVYTGVEPGKQMWRSTGMTDPRAALRQAKEWEAEMKRRRAALGLRPRRPILRVRRRPAGAPATVTPGVDPLSQREVAMIMRISERAVRAIELRAIQKLRRDPKARRLWAELTGERMEPDLEEGEGTALTPTEINALTGLTRSAEERLALKKLLAWIGSREL